MLLCSSQARALEPTTVWGEPLQLDLTFASSVVYGFDSRQARGDGISALTGQDYGFWLNRSNLQGSSGRLQWGLRVDNVWYFRSPDPTDIGLALESERRAVTGIPDPSFFRTKVDQAGLELSNRYINWAYPAKYYLGYTTRHLELTLGDVYAELGRGFVLSVRKQDELSSDTTLRGARLTARLSDAALRMKVSLLGGSMNPLRLDEASGRFLGVAAGSSTGVAGLTEVGMPRAVPTDFAPARSDCQTFATCTYAPDALFAGQVEARSTRAILSYQASVLQRQPALSSDLVRSARRVITMSQSAELPNLAERATLYVEAVIQRLDEASGTRSLPAGHGLYAALSLDLKPTLLSLEAKHYRRLFPLLANVNVARAREYSLLAYSAPPTTEEVANDTEFEGFNTCTSGGKLKASHALAKDLHLEAWLGRYQTWAESASNEACIIAPRFENVVYDAALGVEAGAGRELHMTARLGGRSDHSTEPLPALGGASRVFYSEQNARYALHVPLGQNWTLEAEGLHRRRNQLVGGPGGWWIEGRQVVAIDAFGSYTVAANFEYTTSSLVPSTYVGGEIRYRPTSSSSVGLFVGQRAGALRCVGGVCRFFPPFEGARLDATARF